MEGRWRTAASTPPPLGPLPSPPPWHLVLNCGGSLFRRRFGITGSSSMYFVRPVISDVFGIEGSMKEGPWSYRIVSVLAVGWRVPEPFLRVGADPCAWNRRNWPRDWSASESLQSPYVAHTPHLAPLATAQVTPIYSVILVTVGTVFGQQAFFLKMAQRMWGRFIPALRTKKPPAP